MIKTVLLLLSFASLSFAQEANLSKSDQRVLRIGPISNAQYVTGGLAGSLIGFGLGHALQHRYQDDGAVYTIGEGVSLAIFSIGRIYCLNVDSQHNTTCSEDLRRLQIVGIAGLVGFKIWEIFDLWIAPHAINERYNELKASSAKSAMVVYPTLISGSNLGLGLSLDF